jgi:hypothetical protein
MFVALELQAHIILPSKSKKCLFELHTLSFQQYMPPVVSRALEISLQKVTYFQT